jgi:hypothetical protein
MRSNKTECKIIGLYELMSPPHKWPVMLQSIRKPMLCTYLDASDSVLGVFAKLLARRRRGAWALVSRHLDLRCKSS